MSQVSLVKGGSVAIVSTETAANALIALGYKRQGDKPAPKRTSAKAKTAETGTDN